MSKHAPSSIPLTRFPGGVATARAVIHLAEGAIYLEGGKRTGSSRTELRAELLQKERETKRERNTERRIPEQKEEGERDRQTDRQRKKQRRDKTPVARPCSAATIARRNPLGARSPGSTARAASRRTMEVETLRKS